MKLVSGRFPEANGVAVHATIKTDSSRTAASIDSCFTVRALQELHECPSGVRRVVVNRGEEPSMNNSRDQDWGKGATEQNPQDQGEGGNTSMRGQLGHRDEDSNLKNADSDLSG